MPDIITIVDENDKVIGAETREKAVSDGLIHRIVSILVFNPKGELYLQKRSASRPNWPGMWDTSAGGHVDEGEEYEVAASRELKEEIGLSGIALKKIATEYQEVTHSNGSTLKRFNSIYQATTSEEPKVDNDEVESGMWFTLSSLRNQIQQKPSEFTPTLRKDIEVFEGRSNA